MTPDRHQRLRQQQIATNRVCNRLLLAFVILVVALAIVESWTESAGWPADLARVALAVAALLCLLGVAVAFSASVLFLSPGAFVQPRDRPLPTWGRWARNVKRGALRVFLVVWLPLPFAAFVAEAVGRSSLGWGPGNVFDRLGGVFTAATGVSFLVGFFAALVWLAAEIVAGYREPRRPMSSPHSAGQQQRQPLG